MCLFICGTGVQTDSWTQWSSCTKTCDIGTQSRCRYNNTNQNIEYEEQYCNTQYCPGVDLSCNTTYDCHRQQPRGSLSFECKNKVCRCSLGDEYNKYNCFGKVGNCVIREEPQTALGYKDPSDAYSNHNQLQSCTTNDNSIYELHVIRIFGIDEVYEGFRSINKTVEKEFIIKCSFEATQRFDIGYFLFENYVPDLTKLSNEFGPITSYTRYTDIWSKTTPRIILEVGGSPLQVLTRDYTYDASQLSCESPTPPLPPPPL
ncbi:unnamed protein product [Mytilus edulis]|uniref:Uncharacterized protein n=1 Tax=Mytilus edulis TaxID=6550 RepID=A0A8S3UTH8_MYTED|nr:unnamed protein product [Mytilus edulis]